MTRDKIEVLFVGEENTRSAHFVMDRPEVQAAMYEADDQRFHIDYEYLRQCIEDNKPAQIPLRTLEKQKEWEEKAAAVKAMFKKPSILKPGDPGFNMRQ